MGSGRSRVIPIFLVALVVAGVVVVVNLPATSFEDEPPYSLCPADRFAKEIVGDARVLEEAGDYTGRGPHRLIVDGPSGATEALREDWVVPREHNGRYRTEHLQLVVCEFRHSVGAEGDLQTCPYTPVGGGPTSTFTTQSAKYNYKVYEARTGNMIVTFTLKGVVKECVDFRSLPGGAAQHRKFPADPDFAELERKLKPFVTVDLS